MIEQLRVDDRLIHGQVALVWTKELGTPSIVVANDEADVNDVLKMTLKMATPSGKKLLVKNVEEAIQVFNDPRATNMKIFALTNCVKDALKIAQSCKGLKAVNVANVGRFDGSEDASKVRVSDSIVVNPNELAALKELTKIDIPVFQQVIPSDVKTPVEKLISRFR